MPTPELKEQRFIAEFLKDQNGTKAAIRAGYSIKSARQIAARLLSKDYIHTKILDGIKAVQVESCLTAAAIQKAVLMVLTFDPRQAFSPDGTLKDIAEMPDHVAFAIAGIDVDDSQGEITKLRFSDRMKAAELGAKLLGLINRLEITGKDGAPLIPTAPIDFSGIKTDELRKAIELYPGVNGEHVAN